MDVLIVYESMYGNTHAIAEAVAEGMAAHARVKLVPVAQATQERLDALDLLVIGAPTHAWGMSRPATRRSASDAAGKPGSELTLEPEAAGEGVREWLDSLTSLHVTAGTFDTRMHAPLGLSGSAARKIDKRLRELGCVAATAPCGFFVRKNNRLEAGELDRARAWGAHIVATVALGRA